ncbi:MAG: bifunctional [glutamate--ammonia ligase]-adenylyl-L-tyrosine phosphorylase/[glutamate--ammonia-ligase] adenylyltransferase, partial [Proteobacteria bacterium]|nr:bifunctional [glutamate--ammonia ligase]-adenylyl-L-tyrosine phosphorylase/[glutamate--ammonia-ligase] adenylyltransferase [Pseudomonadota bacterium]
SSEEKVGELSRQVRDINDMVSLQKVLRLFKRREYLRVGIRDLLELAPLEEVMEEISDLASACLEAALHASKNMLNKEYGRPTYINGDSVEKEAGFVILGMGKLGGRELNFSSDIDLIFLYTTEKGETEGIEDNGGKLVNRISLHQYFVKLGGMVVKAMNDVTENGFVFRVDMNLRPDGQSGDLSISLRGAETYYEAWGRTWERSAMLKARPVAGDIGLGDTFLASMRPFMYRKYLDYGAIEEIGAMKKKIDAKIARDDQTLRNLKLGTGGIREIEFFIQALQLINGGKLEAIREKNSLMSLKKLNEANLITKEEEDNLTGAYTFLRKVEHRLQIFQERQTHTLPADKNQLELLAKRVGYRDNALEMFLEDHRRHTENVKTIYSTLFHEAAEKLEEEKSPEILELLEGLCTDDEAVERLSSYGFEKPSQALKNLPLLWNGPPFAHFTEKSRSVLQRLAPLIFKEIIATPEPDIALNRFEKFISSVGSKATLYSLLAQNHHIIKLIVGLFGTSHFLSNIFLSHPDILDSIVSSDVSSWIKSRQIMEKELDLLIDALDNYEDQLDALRRFRNLEILRIGINDVYGEIDIQEVSSQLTWLAEVALNKAYQMAIRQMKEKHGIPQTTVNDPLQEASFAIIAMGKLGGEEMSYSSDLDIIFVYSGRGETSGSYEDKGDLKIINNHEFFAKVGQRIISILSTPTREGYAFKVDTRLRPSGSAGPLVTSLDAFEEYHKQSAQTWEKQALTRAREVAGDMTLGKHVMAIIDENLSKEPITDERVMEIDRIRKRMEFELAKEKEGTYNIKTGKGGLVDIEFIVQFLILKHGASKDAVRSPNTRIALKNLAEAMILPEEDYEVLSNAYLFLRRVENRLRIVHDQSVSELNTVSGNFTLLAKRLGYAPQDLLRDYKNETTKVREIYNRYFLA